MTSTIVVATTVATPTAATAIVSIARSASRRCRGWRTTQHTTIIQIEKAQNETEDSGHSCRLFVKSLLSVQFYVEEELIKICSTCRMEAGPSILNEFAIWLNDSHKSSFPHSSPSIPSAVVLFLSGQCHVWNYILLAFFVTPTLWLPTYSVWWLHLQFVSQSLSKKKTQNSCSFANFLSWYTKGTSFASSFWWAFGFLLWVPHFPTPETSW